MHCLAGLRPAGVGEAELEATYIANLRFAADRFATIGATVTIDRSTAASICRVTGWTSVAKGFACWRRSTAQCEIAVRHLPRADHRRRPGAHAGGPPSGASATSRSPTTPVATEPGTGEINYPFLFDLLDRIGYDGWVGCEYQPLTTTEAGLGWLPLTEMNLREMLRRLFDAAIAAAIRIRCVPPHLPPDRWRAADRHRRRQGLGGDGNGGRGALVRDRLTGWW